MGVSRLALPIPHIYYKLINTKDGENVLFDKLSAID
jgi:hypothetical protein